MKKIILLPLGFILLLCVFTGCDFAKKEEKAQEEITNKSDHTLGKKEEGDKKVSPETKKDEKDKAARSDAEKDKDKEKDKAAEEKSNESEAEKKEGGEEREEGENAFYQNIKETDVSKKALMLCNKNYKLPAGFAPENLAPVPDGYYVMDGKEYELQSEVVDAFVRMADDAASAGLNLKVISGYRTEDYQVDLYNSYGETYGYEEADTYSARPRHSEHETGLCMDINMVDQAFKYTEEYEWLMQNGANYGFILRYPEGKEHITGYIYEPWHWRYVGDKAAEIKVTGLTFDEYYHKFIE